MQVTEEMMDESNAKRGEAMVALGDGKFLKWIKCHILYGRYLQFEILLLYNVSNTIVYRSFDCWFFKYFVSIACILIDCILF